MRPRGRRTWNDDASLGGPQQQPQIVANTTLFDQSQVMTGSHAGKRGQRQQRTRGVAQYCWCNIQQQLIEQIALEQGPAQGGSGFDLQFIDLAFGKPSQHRGELNAAIRPGGHFCEFDAGVTIIVRLCLPRMQHQRRRAAIEQVGVGLQCVEARVQQHAQWSKRLRLHDAGGIARSR